MPPPDDIPPTTPDFTGDQGYLGPAPEGLGFDEAVSWPGGDAATIAIADVEYGWEPLHEDLDATPDGMASGWASGMYVYHGNSVLGQLVGGDNGYGVTGMVPDVQVLGISPFPSERVSSYDVADAVNRAAALLDPGDVLLIEQQGWLDEHYCPVEADPGVFDAISLAVAAGIVVVEPSGNGYRDLDATSWEGAFDRELRDSGAFLVGGGASPESGLPPRSWYPFGSSYGSRIDVQGWYDGIVTATSGDDDGMYADLYYPGDPLQAYTRSFGGTSGASPMVAAVAAIAQSVAMRTGRGPFDPMDLRSLMVTTGLPQPSDDLDHPIGPQPDLRALLRMALSD